MSQHPRGTPPITDPSEIIRALVGLKDVRVLAYVRRGPDVELEVEQVTGAVLCPACGRRAQVKERPVVHYVDLPSMEGRRRRAERALVAVVAQCYVEGVSTRRVDDVVRSMGIEGISKSQVSELAESLDESVAAFRNRPLDAGPYTYIWVDALTQKVREGGRIVNVAVVIATGVNAEGHREILGLDLITTEDGAGWTAFLRGLVARGLSGVQLVVSDAHGGLVDAIASVLPGAAWQRCRGPLRAQRIDQGAQGDPVHGGQPHPLDLRPARRRAGPTSSTPASSSSSPSASATPLTC